VRQQHSRPPDRRGPRDASQVGDEHRWRSDCSRRQVFAVERMGQAGSGFREAVSRAGLTAWGAQEFDLAVAPSGGAGGRQIERLLEREHVRHVAEVDAVNDLLRRDTREQLPQRRVGVCCVGAVEANGTSETECPAPRARRCGPGSTHSSHNKRSGQSRRLGAQMAVFDATTRISIGCL